VAAVVLTGLDSCASSIVSGRDSPPAKVNESSTPLTVSRTPLAVATSLAPAMKPGAVYAWV
jgi:hypothetical protein